MRLHRLPTDYLLCRSRAAQMVAHCATTLSAVLDSVVLLVSAVLQATNSVGPPAVTAATSSVQIRRHGASSACSQIKAQICGDQCYLTDQAYECGPTVFSRCCPVGTIRPGGGCCPSGTVPSPRWRYMVLGRACKAPLAGKESNGHKLQRRHRSVMLRSYKVHGVIPK